MEAAKAWYDGPGYKAIRHLRMDNARYTGLLLEAGFAPEQERLAQQDPLRGILCAISG
jgi:hypothetical protein